MYINLCLCCGCLLWRLNDSVMRYSMPFCFYFFDFYWNTFSLISTYKSAVCCRWIMYYYI